jgi:DNA-binding MarR family transcriptional regulator
MLTNFDPGIFESLHSLMHIYRSKMQRALRETTLDLSHMENKVLGFFARNPNATLSDLAEHSGRDKAQLNRLIKTLKERQLIEEKKDATDRRKMLLTLTTEGQIIYNELHKISLDVREEAIAGLDQDECETLVNLLNKIKENLSD